MRKCDAICPFWGIFLISSDDSEVESVKAQKDQGGENHPSNRKLDQMGEKRSRAIHLQLQSHGLRLIQ